MIDRILRVRAVGALLISLVVAGSSVAVRAQGHVHTDRESARTLPLPSGDDVFHFVIYGDRTGGPAEGIEVLKQAVADTNLLDPDLVMTVGDLVQGYNTTEPWLAQMREFHDVMSKLDMPWYPVAGNHDVYWRGEGRPQYEHEDHYEEHFGPLWYWFRHKDCGFFVLYSDEGNRETGRKGYRDADTNRFSGEQLEWLAKSLSAAKKLQHVFVFLHHPKWQDHYTGANWNDVHDLLVRNRNVRAVFAGHIHRMTYAGVRDGIEYFTLATVGGGLSAEIPGVGLMHHMNVVTVREGGFEVAAIPVGQVADPRKFTAEFLADADRAREVRPAVVSAPLAVSDDGAVEGQVEVSVSNPCVAKFDVTVGVSVVNGWALLPDHQHGTVEPGASRTFRFHAVRAGAGSGADAANDDPFAGFEVPRMTLQVDYLADGARIALPEQSVDLPIDLSALAIAEASAGRDGVLRLGGRGYVAIAPAAFDELPDGPLTLEAWMRADSLDGRTGLATKAENSEFGIFVSNGEPGYWVHVGGHYLDPKDEPGSLENGRWYHLAGVFDGEQARMYVDGRLVATRDGAGARRRNGLPFVVGGDVARNGRGTSLFRGLVDEVRLSTTARYRGEEFTPSRHFDADEATWLLLRFDRAFGPFHPDASGRGHHGRAIGPVSIEPMSAAAGSNGTSSGSGSNGR